MLLLHCPQLLFLLLHLLEHFLLSNLLSMFSLNALNLVWSKSFEVVWFYSVRGKHAHCGLTVLSHKVVISCIILLDFAPH